LSFSAPIGTDVAKAAVLLREGKLVAIPTETVYGLAGNALDNAALSMIFLTKGRPHFDPLIVHIPDMEAVHLYAREFPEGAQKLAERFWPGPLTLVLPKREIIPDLVSAGGPTVALRVPNHPLTQELLHKSGLPLAAPSANPFGYISPTRPEHVAAQLGDRIAYILDGGPCKIGLESTVVSFAGPVPEILRLGGLDPEDIRAIIPKLRLNLSTSANPVAPGQLDKHYAPRTRLVLAADIRQYIAHHQLSDKTALLLFHHSVPDWPAEHQYVLSTSGTTMEAAQHLFALMRQLDTLGYELIIAEEAPETGLGPAINDRLRRASFQDSST
jgi:L-threonylcarbamoyladenylate synthase